MDLLFQNPQYFFETYFAFSKQGFLVSFLAFAIIIYLICGRRFKSKLFHFLFIIFSSAYLALVVSMTLFTLKGAADSGLNLNPLDNIQAMFGENGNRQVWDCVLKAVLYVPAGVFVSLFFIENKFRNSMIFAAVLSVTIEVLQFTMHKGSAGTMDVICNLLGAAVGAFITIVITKNKNYLNDRFRM